MPGRQRRRVGAEGQGNLTPAINRAQSLAARPGGTPRPSVSVTLPRSRCGLTGLARAGEQRVTERGEREAEISNLAKTGGATRRGSPGPPVQDQALVVGERRSRARLAGFVWSTGG